jgi:hypothetical protein
MIVFELELRCEVADEDDDEVPDDCTTPEDDSEVEEADRDASSVPEAAAGVEVEAAEEAKGEVEETTVDCSEPEPVLMPGVEDPEAEDVDGSEAVEVDAEAADPVEPAFEKDSLCDSLSPAEKEGALLWNDFDVSEPEEGTKTVVETFGRVDVTDLALELLPLELPFEAEEIELSLEGVTVTV